MLRRQLLAGPRHLSQRRARLLHARPSLAMARILCSDPIDAACPEILRAAGHDVTTVAQPMAHGDLVREIAQYDALVLRSGTRVDRAVLEAAPQLQLIGRAGTGIDNIDVVTATKRGVLVMNTPFGNTVSAAELTVGLISTLSQTAGSAGAAEPRLRLSEIHDKTLGIIGLGRIGREVAKRCNALGMNVIGYDPILSDASAKAHGVEPVALAELFARSDYISLHVPLNTNTKELVNEQRLALCKDGVKLINGARAGLIDHAALLSALESGKVGGVAFDILPPPSPSDVWSALLAHPNVIVTPHIGALTTDAQQKVARDLAYKLNDALAGKSFKGVVNAPNIDFGRREEHLPFLSLAEKLGSMQAQLMSDSRLARVLVISEGRRLTSEDLSGQLVSGVLKGLLSHMLEEEVTFANAKQLGEIMGIQVVEHKHEEVPSSSFANLLTVVFESEGGATTKISGTVFGKSQLRLVGFNDLSMDAIPSGSMLLFSNNDEPGVLCSVTSVLAQNEINIGCFGLAREDLGGHAVGVLNVDDPIPDHVIDELEALGKVANVRRVNLLELQATPGSRWERFLQPKDDDATANGDDGAVDAGQAAAEGDGVTVVVRHKKPAVKPASPNFGSGPCKKRPGYSLAKISDVCLGRSHRSALGKGLLEEAIIRSKKILGLPEDYLLGIVPASDTGAFEMAMWNMLGPRPVDVCYWESFGQQWFKDATTELRLENVTELSAPFGEIADLSKTNPAHDILFTWNGTTSGVRVPNADWIASDREGLVFNDATSAAFAMDMPWDKIDVCTFSWQKVLGGEGAHGVLILSPRAVERLESFVPENRPMPKIFRLTNPKTGKLAKGIFEGSTINTPSMLCVEDYLDALRWAESVGGVPGLMAISQRNLKVVEDFVRDNSRWIRFLAANKEIRSSTSVCLQFDGLSKDEVKQLTKLLEREQVAVDINSYRDAPPGIRIWCGATVETKDLEALMPWIKWAYHEVKAQASKQQ
ncbi:hypothetical protein ATCC90586_003756 [Pythium insidiosum]|nr:hypothetical protein ATCC90586_003756 [Pythium insidiosum]